MTKEKFETIAKLMGYADKKQIAEYCQNKSANYEYSDDDLMKIYRAANAEYICHHYSRCIWGMNSGYTTKRYDHSCQY